ncbi:HpcH/HpaI aldolase/citrate lyase family protein [Sulfurimonas sp.]
MRDINYLELGGTLFIPATHKDLKAVVSGVKYPTLKSVVVDTEDSINQDELPHAISCVNELLKDFTQSSVLVFLRPRNIDILKEFLACANIYKIDGFVLPKFSLDNADSYLKELEKFPHAIMPSIEGKELFDLNKLLELADKLLPHKDKILLIRFV